MESKLSKQQEEAEAHEKSLRLVRKGFRAPVGKIENILANATKQNLQLIKGKLGFNFRKTKKIPCCLIK